MPNCLCLDDLTVSFGRQAKGCTFELVRNHTMNVVTKHRPNVYNLIISLTKLFKLDAQIYNIITQKIKSLICSLIPTIDRF